MAPHGPVPAAEPEGPNEPSEPDSADPGEGGLSHSPAAPDGAQEQPEAGAQAAESVDGTPTPQPRRRGRRDTDDADMGAPRRKRGWRSMGSVSPSQVVVGDAASGQGAWEDTASEAGSCCSVVVSACSVHSEVAPICSSEHR